MNLRPLHDRVIIKRLDQESKTASGIIIPDAAAEKPDQGEVLAVGPGKRDDSGKLNAPDARRRHHGRCTEVIRYLRKEFNHGSKRRCIWR
jgi:co-chaperonin GroES (HSP10)